ncbi:MAG: glycosyltransferase family 2 protein [Alphaproteobacteria bacterium]|nr:glycosyltransferase family 2 protein [Alphaproteobacteria bacterium]
MRAFVIIATKGRAKETRVLLDFLQRQTLPPAYALIVGSEAGDIDGCGDHPLLAAGRGEAFVSPRVGSTCQRNAGLEALKRRGAFGQSGGDCFCAFFDDDFRPAADWLENAAARFEKGGIVGLTGLVLADGVTTGGLTEEQAAAFLSGKTPPAARYANMNTERETECAYGCNMAFIGTVARDIRFDENLPLYGWQEDRDYTGQCLKLNLGRAVFVPSCVGVHRGVSSGRTSGLRLGYSQIANPLYLMKKGTMTLKSGLLHMARNAVANVVKSVAPPRPNVDYKGRLIGNLRAIGDVLRAISNPRRILDADFQA